jgi:hypothetical protein
MSEAITKVTERVSTSKDTLLAALQIVHQPEFQNKTVADLESYGPYEWDDSFIMIRFKPVVVDADSTTQDTILLIKGEILDLLKGLDPTHYGNKSLEQLVSYGDDPNDTNKIQFVFEMN